MLFVRERVPINDSNIVVLMSPNIYIYIYTFFLNYFLNVFDSFPEIVQLELEDVYDIEFDCFIPHLNNVSCSHELSELVKSRVCGSESCDSHLCALLQGKFWGVTESSTPSLR